MTILFDELVDLKRHLVRRGVDLTLLPPFALSPKQTADLRKDGRVFRENCGLLGATDVFTVHGLRCVRSDRL